MKNLQAVVDILFLFFKNVELTFLQSKYYPKKKNVFIALCVTYCSNTIKLRTLRERLGICALLEIIEKIFVKLIKSVSNYSEAFIRWKSFSDGFEVEHLLYFIVACRQLR